MGKSNLMCSHEHLSSNFQHTSNKLGTDTHAFNLGIRKQRHANPLCSKGHLLTPERTCLKLIRCKTVRERHLIPCFGLCITMYISTCSHTVQTWCSFPITPDNGLPVPLVLSNLSVPSSKMFHGPQVQELCCRCICYWGGGSHSEIKNYMYLVTTKQGNLASQG